MQSDFPYKVGTKWCLLLYRPYFLDKFFHSVWEAEYGPAKVVNSSPYCKYDNQLLQLFQSSMYIAGQPFRQNPPLMRGLFARIFSSVPVNLEWIRD